MKVLSLFDGMSVAQQALKNIGADVEVYYASEIDEYAKAVTQSNHPNTIQLGSVTDIKWGGEVIDLMIGGSPCQDLSIAKKNREGLKGERSGLFYEYVRIRDEVKPKYFILENVASMPKEAKEQISEILGVQPVMINASLVSAQNRKRLFWISSRLDLCYNCKYEQLLKEVQHGGEVTKTQTTSVGELLSEKSKEKNKVQDLQKEVFSQGINSEMLFQRVYEYQQKAERQEGNTEKERLPEEILREKKERITRIWEELSSEQQREFSEILQKIHFQARSQNEEGSERGVEEKQKNYQYDWERGTVGYVEKDKHGVCFLRFYGRLDGRPYNPSEQGWHERFGELTTPLSELQFIQEGQVNHCSCCGGIIPVKYEQVEIPQPEDSGILLKDILEDDVDEKYYLNTTQIERINLSNYQDRKPVSISKEKMKTLKLGGDVKRVIYNEWNNRIMADKCGTLGTSAGRTAKQGYQVVEGVALRNRGGGKQPEFNGQEKANAMTTVRTDSMCVQNARVRHLTPIEYLRLQSMPDDYFDKAEYKGKPISNTQRYKMCGNAFNCKVIEHILKHII
jgi:site-specific DNA-cytosine methylase